MHVKLGVSGRYLMICIYLWMTNTLLYLFCKRNSLYCEEIAFVLFMFKQFSAPTYWSFNMPLSFCEILPRQDIGIPDLSNSYAMNIFIAWEYNYNVELLRFNPLLPRVLWQTLFACMIR